VVVIARMTSGRLPGKSLLSIGRQTLIEAVVERVAQSREIGTVAVATSIEASDDAIEDWCDERDLLCVRGSLEDVACRFLHAGSRLGASHVVRISGDSPFIDPILIDHAVRLSRSHDVDLVTNVFPRTFPKGQSVEVLGTQALRKAAAEGLSNVQREHVTRVFYDNYEDYRVLNFSTTDLDAREEAVHDYSSVQLSIDTEDDLMTARQVSERLGPRLNRCGWRDVVAVWQEVVAGRAP